MEFKGRQNPEKILILRQDNRGKIIDITKDVLFFKEYYNYYNISFIQSNGKLKTYHFSKNKIQVYRQGKEIITADGKTVFIDGNYYNNYKKIIKFGSFFKVFFNNYEMITQSLKLLDNNSTTENIFNVFSYYKELANYASRISNDDNSVEYNLCKLYNNVNKINKNAFLTSFLTKTIKKNVFDKPFIHPYGLNISQYNAIKNAFNHNISVIEGPPGTGKTQTIMNIICNAIINNKKVAVISNNNTAVMNVYEKLEEKGLEFICANLGNYNNVDKFFKTNYKEKIQNFLSNYQRKPVNSRDLYINIKLIMRNFEYQNKVLQLKRTMNELLLEQKHYLLNDENELRDFKINNKFKFDRLLILKNLLIYSYKFNIFERLFCKYIYGFRYSFLKKNKEKLLTYIDKLYYKLKIEEINNKINEYQKFLKKHSLDQLIKNQVDISLSHFENFLFNKYQFETSTAFNNKNYRFYSREFTNKFPLVLSTTHSLLRNVGNDFVFDILVIDESSQSDLLSSILTFNIAYNVMVVGDSKQLPQIDNQEIYEFSENLINKYNIPPEYQYKDNSILNSIKMAFNDVPTTLLKEHYRCEPRIINFCNKKYYSEELIITTKESEYDSMIVVKTVPGNHARINPNGTGQYNLRELDEIKEILKLEKDKEIGIITPFRYQANIIKNELKNYSNIEIDTIHKFQGRQKDVIILSTVVNDLYSQSVNMFTSNFVTNDCLLNVAISRAKSKLYLVVSDKVYNGKNNAIQELIQYIKYHFSVDSQIYGKVTSIYDCLYKDNSRILKQIQKKLKKEGTIITENLTYHLLQVLLSNYKNLEVITHVTLHHLINDLTGFNNYEIKYITHPLTHVDFVIFNNLTKSPILTIEVDGTRYHEQNKKQSMHDDIKNRILKANNLPILRLKTNESNEKKRIVDYLDKALLTSSSTKL